MTKNRQKRFSNGKNQTQKKTVTLDTFKKVKQSQAFNLSLQEAYEIVGGYRQISAKSDAERTLIYRYALDMVQKDDSDFAQLLKADKVKHNAKVQQALDRTRAYEIVGGFETVDKKTFDKAVELLKADKTDPEFAAILIKFAESHTSFREADNDVLQKIDEEGLAFFANQVNVAQTTQAVAQSAVVQEAFTATSIDSTEKQKEDEKAAQESLINTAIADVAMETIENGIKEEPFEERVEKQVEARVVQIRLQQANEEREECVIQAIKQSSDKPLSRFRQTLRDAFDFKKKIKVSVPSVSKVCEKAAIKWGNFTKNLYESAEKSNVSAKIKVLANKARSKAAILMAGAMLVVSCGQNVKPSTTNEVTYTQAQVDSIKQATTNEAVANYIAEQQRQADEAAAAARAAEAAARDSIQNMAVPHEWNDSTMRTIRGQAELNKIMNYYNQADSGRYDRMYRNLEMIKDSLPTFQHRGDSVATQVDNEAVMKRLYQQLQFQYQTNDDGTTSERQAYIVAQALVQALNRPCDDQEFNPNDIKKSDLQLLFDTPIPVMNDAEYTFVGQPYMSKEDCGEDVKTLGTRRVAKKVEKPATVVVNDSVATDSVPTIKLGVESVLTAKQDTSVVINHIEPTVTKHKTSVASDGSMVADTDLGDAKVSTALAAGQKAADNKQTVFVDQGDNQLGTDSTTVRPLTLGIDTNLRNDSVTISNNDSITTDSVSTITLGVASSLTAKQNDQSGNVTITKHNTSVASDGSVTADENLGDADTSTALAAGQHAAKNKQTVFAQSGNTTVATSTNITLGVASNVNNDSITINNDSIVADSTTFTGSVDGNFTLQNDTIGYKILTENDSVPMGTSVAWGEISGRSGWNFTSVTEKQINDDKRYFGAETYDNSISVLENRPELFKFGQVFEGLTPHEVMRSTRALMKWSVKRNGDFAKFRVQALALNEFIKGKCKDSFTAEETTAIRDAFAAVHTNMSIDNVIGRGGNNNMTYTLNENCDNLGRPTFVNGSSSNVTRPSGPYFEQRYLQPIVQQRAPLIGVASSFTFSQETEQTPVSLRKVKTSTNSAGATIAATDKGEVSVADATRAGNKAALNTSTVFVEPITR